MCLWNGYRDMIKSNLFIKENNHYHVVKSVIITFNIPHGGTPPIDPPPHHKQFSINKYKAEQTSHTSLYIATKNQLPVHKALITRNENLFFFKLHHHLYIQIHRSSYATNNVLTQKSRYRWIDAVIMWPTPQTKSYFHYHCKLLIKTGGNS